MDYYCSLIYSAESDSKTLFRTITRLLHRKADRLFPTSSSTVDLADKFFHFFWGENRQYQKLSWFTCNSWFLWNPRYFITNQLSWRFSICHWSGYFPSFLKTALLSPLLKKANLDHEVLANYRPISNLKVISKIVEKVVAVRLQKFWEANQLNKPLQFAYKSFHSCETVLVRVHNDVLVAIDKRQCVMLLLLDLSAAFDSPPYKIAL